MQPYTERMQIYLSPYSVSKTMQRLRNILDEKHVRIFAHIDHQEAASEVGMQLNAIQVLIFGDPKVGTLLMQAHPAIAYELPLRIVAWQEDDGTKVGFTKLDEMAAPYPMGSANAIVEKMSGFMEQLVTSAVSQ